MRRQEAVASHTRRSDCTPVVHDDTRGRRRIRVAGTTFLVYQIHYGGASARRLDPLYTPYRNPRLGPFFESAVIANLLAAGHHRAADYFGVFSWKCAAKIPLSSRDILARIGRDACSADVYSFFGRITEGRLWPLAERKHPGILDAAMALMDRVGIAGDLARLDAPIIYQNHFLCRSPLYERFWRDLLAPALCAMQDPSDTELQHLLQQDARYRDPRMPVPRLVAIFGHPHYGMQPFICERLFSTWLGLNPSVRVRHVWRGRFVERDNVHHEPEMARAAAAP